MKKIVLHLLSAFFVLSAVSCDVIKSEDQKISDILIGKCYEDDREDESGKITDISLEYFKDGKYKSKATLEVVNENSYDNMVMDIEITGTWKVKDKFIYYTYDFDKMKITPSEYMFFKDEMIKGIKDKNSPDKVIEYDAAKIVYEDSDGERHTLKKSY